MDGWEKAHAAVGLLWVLAFWFDLRAGFLAGLWDGGNAAAFSLTLGLTGVLAIGALFAVYCCAVTLCAFAEIVRGAAVWLRDRLDRKN